MAEKSGPITQDFVDKQTKSQLQKMVDSKAASAGAGLQIRSDIASAVRGNTAIAKANAAQVLSTKYVNKIHAADVSTLKALTSLEETRTRLIHAQGQAARRNNKELVEHLHNLVQINKEQLGHVRQTLQLEHSRMKVVNRMLHLGNKTRDLSKSELELQTRSRHELDKMNSALTLRTRVERESVLNNKSIADAKSAELKTEKDRQAYETKTRKAIQKRASVARTIPGVDTNVQPDDVSSAVSASGTPKGGVLSRLAGSASSGIAGLAGVLAGVSGIELLKTGMKGLSQASDLATESQYHFGTSMDRIDQTASGYASRAKRIIATNTSIGLSYARMGLSAEEADEILPKLLTTSGVALKAYQENNTDALEGMAKAAGAFSRQTGVSLDDAVALQNTLMNTQGRTASQAAGDLDNITGSIQGMNNYLQDAGFRGALLNIGEYANLTKEAAENTEALSFNTSDYAKRLAVAATNVRLMGATEKEAQKFAASKGKLYGQKNPFVDMQVGKKILETLQGEYAGDIKSGNAEAITKSLIEKHGLASNQAALAASYLVSKKPIPMLANQMAEILKESDISRSAIDSALDGWMKKTGITKTSDVGLAANDPVLMSQLGLDWTNPQDRLTAVDYAQDYLIRNNLAKPDAGVADRMNQLRNPDEYLTKAAAGASATGLQDNAPANIDKLVNRVKTYASHPGVALPAGVLALAGAGYAGKKMLNLSKLLAPKVAGETALKSIGSEGAEAIAQKSGSKLLPSLLKGAMHNKRLALLAGGAAALGYGGSKLVDQFNPSDENYTGTLGENVGDAGMNAAGEGVVRGGLALGKMGLSKAAPGMAAKMVSGKLAATAVKGIPIAGSLISGAMTYAMTEGNWKRKLAAATGDAVGGLLGTIGGPIGSIAGGAAGQLATTQLYDWIAGTDAKGQLNTAGALSRTGKMDTQPSTSGTAGTASQQGSGSQITGASIGRLGSVNPDGSVNMVINARVQNFAPAVAQANTQTFARQTQFSGAQK